MRPTSQVLIYKVRAKKNGRYPVKLRIVFQRQHRDFKIGLDLTEQEFEDAILIKPPKASREHAAKIFSVRNKAEKVISELKIFTFDKFQSIFTDQQKDASNIFPFFNEYILDLKKDERIKTAISYQTAMNTFQRFTGKKKLSLFDITPDFLKKFNAWMQKEGNSSTTVGIYTRTLRVIYNYCISKGVIKRDENYPFGRGKFIIPAGRNIKKALSLCDIKKIYHYKAVPGSMEDRAKDMWLFSYLCNGMNFRDIAMLKRKDLDGDMLRFVREKTKRTSQGNKTIISCYISTDVRRIIDKWGSYGKQQNDFLFPILSEGDTPTIQIAKIAQFIKLTNKYMKRICISVGLDKMATTYYSRHSAATILKRSGASISQIQEALGHSSSAVTQKYLDSFEDETKKELAQSLINFS